MPSFWGSRVDLILERAERALPLFGYKLSLIEFAQEDYEVLSEAARSVVGYPHRYLFGMRLRQARLLFLAFALEYVRRSTYLSDAAFWQGFEQVLGLGAMERRRLITDDLLWPSFEEFGIVKRTGLRNRLIVRSLVDAANVQRLNQTQFENFFIWYFQTCPISNVTSDTLDLYERSTKKRLTILRQALPVLDEDCRMLSTVVERIIDLGVPVSEINLDDLVPENLWQRRFRAINGRERLKRIVTILENRVTPEQFVRLVRHSAGGLLVRPDGTRIRVSSLSWLGLADIDYGIHKFRGQDYQVVPIRWLGLSDIEKWATGSLVRYGRFVGYKKQTLFTVRVGSTLCKSRKVWFRRTNAYVWLGPIVRGQPLVVDGHAVNGTVGLSAKVSLRLGQPEDDMPAITIVFDSIVANYPTMIGKQFRASSTAGHQFLENVRQDGTLVLKRVVVFRLDSFEQPVTVQCGVEGEAPFVHCFEPSEVLLFSGDTLDLIVPGHRQTWGGRRFCLFHRSSVLVEVHGGTVQESISGIQGFQALKIVWDGDAPLEISAGSSKWYMESAAYCIVQLQAKPLSPMLELGSAQVCSFTDMAIEMSTNLSVEDPTCTLEVAYEGTRITCVALSDCLVPAGVSTRYSMSHQFIQWLDAASCGQFGQYTFIVRVRDDVVTAWDVSLVPQLSIEDENLKRVRSEGSVCVVRVSSPLALIWDPRAQRACSKVDLPVNCELDIDSEGLEVPPGLPKPLVSRVQSTVLSFPDVGQTVRLKFQPNVLGFRLYRRLKDGRSSVYIGVTEVDYSLLASTVVQIVALPAGIVHLKVNGTPVLDIACDEKWGNSFVNLAFLQAHCRNHSTWVNLVCDQADVGFRVVWTPRISAIRSEKRVLVLSGNGPRDCGLILRIMDSDLKTVSERLLNLPGGDFEVSAQLSGEEMSRGRYAIPYYRLSDGTVLQSSSQLRMSLQMDYGLRTRTIPHRGSIGLSESLAALQQVREGGSSK